MSPATLPSMPRSGCCGVELCGTAAVRWCGACGSQIHASCLDTDPHTGQPARGPVAFADAVELDIPARVRALQRHLATPGGDTGHALAALAYASAVETWAQAHRQEATIAALRAGANLNKLATARGVDEPTVAGEVADWAISQRRVFDRTRGAHGISAAEAEHLTTTITEPS